MRETCQKDSHEKVVQSHCRWMTCKRAAPWFRTCVTCRLHPIKEIKCYLGLDNGKWGRAIQKHNERNVATLVMWQNHSLHPSFPPPPLVEHGQVTAVLWYMLYNAVVWLATGRKTGDIKRCAQISDSQEGHLSKFRWANSAQNNMLTDTVSMSKRRARSLCYTGRMICLEYKWHLSL